MPHDDPTESWRRGGGRSASPLARSHLEITLAYHERTKHHPFRFAPSLGFMDWATQPNPFRRFEGAPLLPLEFAEVGPEPRFDAAFVQGTIEPAPLDRAAISRLFQDALALSAWKQAGRSRWALRVNPSSGNLHPTEGYLVSGPVPRLHARPAVYHYAPHEHALELRAELPDELWRALAARLPAEAVLVGLTSVYWRESWKYGERAFRYCHHDAGHAIGSVAIAAAGLGWTARLLEGLTDAQLTLLLGLEHQKGIEAEHPDCLLVVFPGHRVYPVEEQRRFGTTVRVSDALRAAGWLGVPAPLSPSHHPWPIIDEVAAATEKTAPPPASYWVDPADAEPASLPERPLSFRAILHQRRSAVAFDGATGLGAGEFYRILLKTMLAVRPVPFATLPWRPCVDLLLFVHRVDGLGPGLYVCLRDAARRTALAEAMNPAFAWTPPAGCPPTLPLYLLQPGDARRAAQQTSCDQEIAADGAFAVAMLAEFRPSLDAFGPWHYRRLFWETGVIGQMLYLEAEACGLRGTGIGCFFDDLTHGLFGLAGDRFQVLYHFTVGGAVEDPRLQTHPPYGHLSRAQAPC